MVNGAVWPFDVEIFLDKIGALSIDGIHKLSGFVLAKTFVPLGATVTSLYGAAGATVSDARTLASAAIVVATPEKLDFAPRQDANVLNDVGLIVFDEGHMIGLGSREIRYEVLIRRLSAFEGTPVPSLVKALARARRWYERIVAGEIGTVGELAQKTGLPLTYVKRILEWALLPPDYRGGLIRETPA